MTTPPAPIRLVCPACGRFLATIEGTSVECPPCVCGVQTTVRVNRKRRPQCDPARVTQPLETK